MMHNWCINRAGCLPDAFYLPLRGLDTIKEVALSTYNIIHTVVTMNP